MPHGIDKIVSLYVDCPRWAPPIDPDDFLVAVGKKQSNSVYHVLESKYSRQTNGMVRYRLKVLKSDLQLALMRDKDKQKLITLTWNKR